MYRYSSCRTNQQNFQQNNFNKTIQKRHASVPNSKVIENKSVRIVLRFFCFFFHFFFFFLFSTTFSGSFLFFLFFCFFKFFLTVTGSACIFFLLVFNLFFYFLSVSGQLLILCLLLLSIAYEYPPFLSSFFFCFKISRVFFPKPSKLLLIQPTKFLPQNNSKSESVNIPLHIIPPKFCAYLNYLQNPVSEYLP